MVCIATQGGGAHILACFGNSLLLMLDRDEHLAEEGSEYPHAYRHGPYKYLSRHPPKLWVARNFADFNAALNILGHTTLLDKKFTLPAAAEPLIRKLSL